MVEWNDGMAGAMREFSEKWDDSAHANCELDPFALAVAAYREIVRLEARHAAIREAAQCPPDADMTQWARTLASTWIEYNRMTR